VETPKITATEATIKKMALMLATARMQLMQAILAATKGQKTIAISIVQQMIAITTIQKAEAVAVLETARTRQIATIARKVIAIPEAAETQEVLAAMAWTMLARATVATEAETAMAVREETAEQVAREIRVMQKLLAEVLEATLRLTKFPDQAIRPMLYESNWIYFYLLF
jgi:hypothetical protein